jgi:hypothetical protein
MSLHPEQVSLNTTHSFLSVNPPRTDRYGNQYIIQKVQYLIQHTGYT